MKGRAGGGPGGFGGGGGGGRQQISAAGFFLRAKNQRRSRVERQRSERVAWSGVERRRPRRKSLALLAAFAMGTLVCLEYVNMGWC
jgi:hypothetical protein